MNAIALDVSDLHPSATLGDMPMLWTVLAVAVAAAAACAVAMTLYGRRRARRAPAASAVAHAQAGSTQQWLARVDDVVRQYDAGAVTADEAYAHLAALTREFAAAHSGRALSTSTLRELKRRPTGGTAANWDALRLTIAALYPPEFADAATNAEARDASVHTAAGWVGDFMERWR
ncbi:hypothetical protein AALA26_00900 [Bifidobacterium pseudolongum]|uniref:Uncharacterized protein n=2 Tax=Bifidobacterium pseudolongum TaxID=1694 RepID=A0AB37P5M3_9BIFI|nr:hypothetical protein [Bifidobacterium pseudolongum]RKI89156.1 hypothetical protein D7V89_02140 [Bifidobacterium pseudolongum]